MGYPDDGDRKAPKDGAGYVADAPVVRLDPNQLALFKAEILAGLRPEEDLGPTLGEFWPRYLEGYVRAERQKPRGVDSKLSLFRNHLSRFGARRLGSFTAVDVADIKTALARHAPKTVNNVLSVLSKLLRVAVDWGEIPRVPIDVRMLKTDLPSPRFYEFDEYRRLVEVAMVQDFRKWALVLLAGDAGLRRSEIIGLRWEDGVDFRRGENGQLYIIRGISRGVESTPKSGKARWVPMTSRLEAALQGVFADSNLPRPMGPVLCRDNGGPLTDKVVYNWMRQVQRPAGLDDRGDIHVLRHTFCSHLAMRGASPRVIQDLAGHASIRTTERYMHLAPSEKGRAIAMLNDQPGIPMNAVSNETEWRRRESKKKPEHAPTPHEFKSTQSRTGKSATRALKSTDGLAAWRSLLDGGGS